MFRALIRLVVLSVLATLALVLVPSTADAAYSARSYETDVQHYANRERLNRDLRWAYWSSCLDRYAEAQAARMAKAKRMYHQDMMTIARACRLNLVGENVAVGFSSGRTVTSAWMASPGHRSNLLHKDFRLIGVGAVQATDGRWYVSQVFGRTA